MARGKVSQGKRAPKARAEKPVSEEIRQAAKRAGYSPSQAETAVRMAAAAAAESPETMAEWTERRVAFASQPLTLTLAEACDLVGRDLSPTDFQQDVFNVLARELDVLSDLAENASGFDGWCAFQNLRSRIELAGKIAAVIGGAS